MYKKNRIILKPVLLDRSNKLNSSFTVEYKRFKNFLKVWHYHSELELVLLLRSKGTRFVGNHVDKFKDGELVLLGKNLPHMWINDAEYFRKDSNLYAEAVVIHFKDDFVGNAFMNLSEVSAIANLLEKSKAGIKFSGDYLTTIKDEIIALLKMDELERLISFLNILKDLSIKLEQEILSSDSINFEFNKADKRKLEPIYKFIVENYRKKFTLEDISKVACMNPSSFSRYFKRVHKKTLTRYVNELRVGYASKLLRENNYPIAYICYKSGFNNLSNFNRQFKNIFSCSPSEYLKTYLKADI